MTALGLARSDQNSGFHGNRGLLWGYNGKILSANFVCGGYTVFTLSVRAWVCPSVTFCFLSILKSQYWIFIKLFKHVHFCKTNTLDLHGKSFVTTLEPSFLNGSSSFLQVTRTLIKA